MDVHSVDDFVSQASKVVPTSQTMDMYISMLNEAISSAVTAMEGNQEATAAMYIGEADMALKHINAVWSVIMQRN